MAKVITFSRYFPKGHPQAGRPTHFPEKIVRSLGYDPGSDQYWALLHELNSDKRFLVDRFILSLNSFLPQGAEKLHTIRAKSVDKKTGETYSRWKQGDKASIRVWSGKPYNSPQIIIAPDVELVQVYDCEVPDKRFHAGFCAKKGISRSTIHFNEVAKNDGLSTKDFLDWFKYPQPFEGQILCWKEVDYV